MILPEGLGACPLPVTHSQSVLMGHGGGGRLTADLLNDVFLPGFQSKTLSRLEDQATVSVAGSRLAFTTDSFVVRPLFFPGGDIGKLAVYGTVNDLAVGGARPLYLSAAFIIEEGFGINDLKRVVASMREACEEAEVELVTGDTKVVERGKGDQLFITTSGIGLLSQGTSLSISGARPGDHILISGTLGDHGITIMSVREGLEFETELRSDCAALHRLAESILLAGPNVRCMRDLTRGGLASALNELARASRVGVRISERNIPMRREVKGACELLGLDPLYVANEGKLMAVVPPSESERVLRAMQSSAVGTNAAVIGEVCSENRGFVTLESVAGGERIVNMLAGEQLPRIC